ncbi:MAG: hypothetical protein HY921_11345 [Elusimicrobia bacterium]|nr:hypothetical protein [Elusimicrobiota bacterium]
MKSRAFRWTLFFLSILFLAWSLFRESSWVSIGGFFVCGGAWYGLTWLKTRELDSPSPK